MTVDVEVFKLAERFAADAEQGLDGPGHVQRLAEEIQDCIESYISSHNKEGAS